MGMDNGCDFVFDFETDRGIEVDCGSVFALYLCFIEADLVLPEQFFDLLENMLGDSLAAVFRKGSCQNVVCGFNAAWDFAVQNKAHKCVGFRIECTHGQKGIVFSLMQHVLKAFEGRFFCGLGLGEAFLKGFKQRLVCDIFERSVFKHLSHPFVFPAFIDAQI